MVSVPKYGKIIQVSEKQKLVNEIVRCRCIKLPETLFNLMSNLIRVAAGLKKRIALSIIVICNVGKILI